MEARPRRESVSPKNLSYRGVPREYHHATLDQYDITAEKKTLIKNYMDNLPLMIEDNIGLIMYGSNGSGKTYLASLVVKEAYFQRYKSFIITIQSLIDLKFKSNRDEDSWFKFREIVNADILVIDELGKETFSEKQFNITLLEEILRHRDTKGLPTFLLTNLPLDSKNGLYDQYGKSITSLIDGKFMQVEFTEEDNRPQTTMKKKGLRVLLGEE